MTDMPGPGALQRPLIKVAGTALSPELSLELVDCRVEKALNRPAKATLRFNDEEYKLIDATQFEIGKEIQVGFRGDNGEVITFVFVGEIISIGLEMGPNDEPVLMLTAYDASYKLGRSSVAKAWVKQTYSDILKSMCGTAGLSFQGDTLPQVFEHVLQTMDNGAMLQFIVGQTGTAWYVDEKKLHVVKPALGSPVATVEMRKDMRRFRAVASATDAAQEVTVRGWDAKSKVAVVGKSGTATKLSDTAMQTGARGKATSNYASKRSTLATRAMSVKEAETIAAALSNRSASDELIVRGETDGNPVIDVDKTLDVKGVGTKLSGKYYITAVEHVFTSRDFRTRFTSGNVQPAHLVDLLGGGSGPAQWQARGPVVGVVTEVGEGEFIGKVKVKLPSQDDQLVTDWARLVSLGAGAGRGLLLKPHINDEVLLMFEDGDTRRPVVLGGVWNGKDKLAGPPLIKSGEPQEWLLKSRLGHTITLRDGAQPAEQNVEIALKDQSIKLYLGMDKVELIGLQGKTMQLKVGDASITFTANGDIEVKANKIKLTATADLAVKGMKVTMDADATIAIKGGGGVDVGGPKVKIAGDGMTEISGGIVKIN